MDCYEVSERYRIRQIGRKWRKRRRLAVVRHKDKHIHTTRGGRGEFARLRRR